MLRVLICHSNNEILEIVRENIKNVFNKINKSYQLAKYEITENEDVNIFSQISKFDIFFIEADTNFTKKISEKINSKSPYVSIVYISKSINQIERLLVYRPVGYINEDINSKDVYTSLKNSYRNLIEHVSFLKIKTKSEIIKVSVFDIDYIENNGRVVTVHNFEKKEFIEFYAKFDDIYKELPNDIFVKCHQSLLVNMNYVYKFDKHNNCFVLKSGKTLDVSRRYSKVAAQSFAEYLRIN